MQPDVRPLPGRRWDASRRSSTSTSRPSNSRGIRRPIRDGRASRSPPVLRPSRRARTGEAGRGHIRVADARERVADRVVEACQAMAALALGDAAAARDGAQAVIDAGDRNSRRSPRSSSRCCTMRSSHSRTRRARRALPIVRARQRLLAIAEPTADRAEAFRSRAGRPERRRGRAARAASGHSTGSRRSRRLGRERLASLDADAARSSCRRRSRPSGRLGARPHASRVFEPTSTADPRVRRAAGNRPYGTVPTHSQRDRRGPDSTVGARPGPLRPRDRPARPFRGRPGPRRVATVEFEHVTKVGRPEGEQPRRRQRPVAVRAGRQDLRAGRAVRLRQDHLSQDGQPADRADLRTDPHRRRRRFQPAS